MIELLPEHDPDAEAFAAFAERADGALSRLFGAAQGVDEVQFSLALSAEMRGMQDAGWNTAHEAMISLDQYVAHIQAIDLGDPMRVRIALSLYSHLSEAAGFYEVPKNMLRIVTGGFHSMWPFLDLVAKHARTGEIIAPNANRIMKDLLGHAKEAGYDDLAEVILEAFDADLRNGYAHADYVIWADGIRLRRRNGGQPKVVPYDNFIAKLNRAIVFFRVLREVIDNGMRSYDPPRLVKGRMNSLDPAMYALIGLDTEEKAFTIRMGGNIGPGHPDVIAADARRRAQIAGGQ